MLAYDCALRLLSNGCLAVDIGGEFGGNRACIYKHKASGL